MLKKNAGTNNVNGTPRFCVRVAYTGGVRTSPAGLNTPKIPIETVRI